MPTTKKQNTGFDRKKLVSELGFSKNQRTQKEFAKDKFDRIKFVSYTKTLLDEPELVVEITFSYERKALKDKWKESHPVYVALCVENAVDVPLPKIRNNYQLSNFIASLESAINLGIKG
jgi:hypothetical protein